VFTNFSWPREAHIHRVARASTAVGVSPETFLLLPTTEVDKGIALEELRHMRTLDAAVRELKRKDPVTLGTLDEGHSPC
jgi:hypothetical protein